MRSRRQSIYFQALQLCAPRWLRESGFGLDRAADMLEGLFGEAARLGQLDHGVCKFFNLLLECLMLLWYATGRDPLSYGSEENLRHEIL